MQTRDFFLFIFITATLYSSPQVIAEARPSDSSSFSVALEMLQHQINYTFKSDDLLRRAMTHASYSEENNKALGVLGASLMEFSVSLGSLTKDIDISAKDLNRLISETCKVETSCAVDGARLGLQKIVRVSTKTDSSTPAVVCGAFRAMLGAIAVDSGTSDRAGSVFWSIHSRTGVAHVSTLQKSINQSSRIAL